eukprot:CAMPEP_0113696282 /NCGR_PEP_ID=MMETSP0038_2-20120614/21390_1 /TAXON_ID=2898 /ORGANISM="Cryptomonas paramecium" /LENGTH=170 /DNA_ID=CAMNT_0000618961 /DNA_START=321 /DNA_END=831 /DNA_ORIENTATION=+ /assembly_acc=CAM_ASM_000170
MYPMPPKARVATNSTAISRKTAERSGPIDEISTRKQRALAPILFGIEAPPLQAAGGLMYKWVSANPLLQPSSPRMFAAPMGRRDGQRLWVGAGPPMNPPDGDYPGGSTGIPLDGYIGFDTGYASDGPYHGMQAPLYEAGLYNARRPSPQYAMPVFVPADPEAAAAAAAAV